VKQPKKWFNNLQSANKVVIISVAVALPVALGVGAVAINSQPLRNTETKINNKSVAKADIKTETKTEVRTEVIPYSTGKEDSDSLDKGKTRVKVTGVNGEKTITDTITYTNGVESKRSTKEVVTKAPTNEIILVGTHTTPIYNPYGEGTSAWYVYKRRAEVGKPILVGLGMPSSFPINASNAGYLVNRIPEKWSIGTLNNSVGFVEAVNEDGSFKIDVYGYAGTEGLTSFSVAPTDSNYPFYYFIH
jgi:surface antigen